jgi:hypothetical protein
MTKNTPVTIKQLENMQLVESFKIQLKEIPPFNLYKFKEYEGNEVFMIQIKQNETDEIGELSVISKGKYYEVLQMVQPQEVEKEDNQ